MTVATDTHDSHAAPQQLMTYSITGLSETLADSGEQQSWCETNKQTNKQTVMN